MQTNKIKNNMKPAIVDQILLWMVLVIGFVTLLFITVDYSVIIRLKSNNDTLAQQGVRMMALGKTADETATVLNNIKVPQYADVAGADIVCDEVVDTSHQVTFTVNSTYTDARILTFNDTITSTTASFNETNSNEITCTLTMSNN